MEVTSQSYIALHTDPYTNGLFVELPHKQSEYK